MRKHGYQPEKNDQEPKIPTSGSGVRGKNSPDVILELTHEQATFLLDTCTANIRLGLALVMSLADEEISQEEKMIKADKIENLRKKYSEILNMLRKAGAQEGEAE